MNISFLGALLQVSSEQDTDRAIKQSVIDNIKRLLESRQTQSIVSEDYPLARSALYGFGLSVSHLNRSHYQGNQLCREIEQLLSHYEPRLQRVLVEMVQLNELGNSIRFRIEGVIVSGSYKAPVGLDSELNLTDTRLDIEETSIV